ncbi:hypothetical protein DASC09_037060 [Saccharomycopsis crataegensis]|uniref:Uncharacterized protein n=1 Tax=Saccharomycopsis crataegensis TaxID=43959 RepID=A0AAV5QP44_9ASCO|nr:hypothetical protein DASC09_037060 [Saccharomycopsis crataegensis]
MGAPIYFVALITRDNRPLHIQKFSPFEKSSQGESEIQDDDKATTSGDTVDASPCFVDSRSANELLKYNFLSNMALDVFSSALYEPSSVDQNCSLLFVEDGISVYGYETNTGLKIVVGTATHGAGARGAGVISEESGGSGNGGGFIGVGGGDVGKSLDGIFKNIHKAYLRLICNPFQPLDENAVISSKKLDKSIVEVVEVWNGQQ